MRLVAQDPPGAFTQFCWIRYWRVPSVMLASDPFGTAKVLPNVQAHLSAFSMPRVSYQALRSGSVTDSSSSWAITLTMASAGTLSFGDVAVWAAQAFNSLLGSPTKEYLMS